MTSNWISHLILCFIIGYTFAFYITFFAHFYAAFRVYEKYKLKYKLTKYTYYIIISVIMYFIIYAICCVISNISPNIDIGTPLGHILNVVFIIGIITMLLIAINICLLFHNISLKDLKALKKEQYIILLKVFLLFPLGMHEQYISAYYKDFKLNILEEKHECDKKNIRKDLLIVFNRANILLSCCITIIFFALFILLDGSKYYHEEIVLYAALCVLIRTCGRSIEIICAFYNDATNTAPKKSSLSNNDRLKLAIFSFLELLVLYAGVYCIFRQQSLIDYIVKGHNYSIEFNINYIILAIVDSFKNGTIVCSDFLLNENSVLYSDKLVFIREALFALFAMLHTLTNLVLTIFSVAKYFPNDKE